MSAVTCLICEGRNQEAEFVFPYRKPICSSCINELSTSSYIFRFAALVAREVECTFCLPGAERLTIPGEKIEPTKRLLKYETVTICSECVHRFAIILELEHNTKESFFNNQGPECGPEKCRAPECERLRIRLAVYCLQHQYEDRNFITGRGLEGYKRDSDI